MNMDLKVSLERTELKDNVKTLPRQVKIDLEDLLVTYDFAITKYEKEVIRTEFIRIIIRYLKYDIREILDNYYNRLEKEDPEVYQFMNL